MLTPRARAILQTIRVIGSLAVVATVVSIWTVKPNPLAGLQFAAFIVFGFPAAFATLVIMEDNWRRK